MASEHHHMTSTSSSMEMLIKFVKQRPFRIAAFATIVSYIALIICSKPEADHRILTAWRSQSTIPKKWVPVDCQDLRDRSHQVEENVDDPNDGEMLARWTTSDPPFFVSIHQFQYDRMRRVIYDSGEYYEMALTAIFSSILKDAPADSRVLDVGGNIGWFSLLSAAHGHHVDVFEPNLANVLRLCESKLLNSWTNAESDITSPSNRLPKLGTIDIHPYGVGSNETTMPFYVGRNPGKATLLRSMLPKWRSPTTNTITIVPLDLMAQDLKWFDGGPSQIAILKVDVEGYEPAVFAGARRLLQSGLVQNILMEMTFQEDDTDNAAMLQLIYDSGYRVHQIGHSRPQTIPLMDQSFVTNFLKLYATKPGAQQNIWWKRKAVDSDL